MNKYSFLLSNTIVFAIGYLLVKLITFFLMPLYTSVLTTEEYGISELINNSIEIVFPILSICIVDALFRFSIDSNVNHKSLFMNSLYVLILGALILAFSVWILSLFSSFKYTFEFFCLYLATVIYKLTTQFARGLGHAKRFALIGVFNAILLVAFNYYYLVINDGGIKEYLQSYTLAYLISGIAAFCISREYLYFDVKAFNSTLLKAMLIYSLPIIPNMLSWWITNISDRYMVLFFSGAALAGLYTAASKLPSIVNMVSSIFQQAWQYSTSIEINKDDNKEFFSNVLRTYSYFCCVLCGVLVALIKPICSLLLKADFFNAWKYIPLLLFSATIGCIATYFGTFYQALKDNKMLLYSTLAGAISNIVLNLFLIPYLNVIGAALSTLVSYLIILIVRYLDLRNIIQIDVNYSMFVFRFFILLVMSILPLVLNTSLIHLINILLVLIIIVLDINSIPSFIHRLKNVKAR